MCKCRWNSNNTIVSHGAIKKMDGYISIISIYIWGEYVFSSMSIFPLFFYPFLSSDEELYTK